MPVIFLLNGTTSFPDPGNWNTANNKVECLGSGHNGGNAYLAPLLLSTIDEPVPTPLAAPNSGGGGGGGGYGWAANLAPTFPVTVNVALKNQTGINNFENSANTYWQTYTRTAGGVSGWCGDAPNLGGSGFGGQFYPQGFNGGNGGGGGNGYSGSGGGGAAGPHGTGFVGAIPTGPEPQSPGAGGGGDNGTTGSTGSYAAGANGTQWDTTHGCGGGGSGGASAAVGPNAGYAGGKYGGGGGGQAAGPTLTAGIGQDGLIIITYTPFVTPVAQVIVVV